MSKYLKVLFVAMFATFLFSSSASAATVSGCTALSAAGNCPLASIISGNSTIATELVGSTTSYTATAGLFVAFNASNAFAVNDLLTFTVAGATVTDTSIGLCGNGSTSAPGYAKVGTLISATDATNGVSTMTFRFDNATGYLGSLGVYLWPSANASTANCAATPIIGGHALTLKFPASTSSGATVTVAASATTGGGTAITGATVSAATQFTVTNQFSQTITADTAAIDFATGRVKIIPNTSTTAGTLDQTTANAWATNNATMTIGYTQTTSDKLDITLAGSMTGISRICWNDATCASTSTTKFTISTTANTATYSVSYATAVGDFDSKITFVVDGTTVLSPRTFTVTTVNNAGSGSVLDRTLLSAKDFYSLTLASYQAIIPYISANSTYKTICFINNGYTLAAPAVVDILTTESASSLTSLTNLTVGTVAVNGTTRVDFDANITPYTYASGVETAGTAVALGFNAGDRYSAKLTVNAAAANVTVNCIQLDPAGSKRAVPVLSSANGWAQ